jgi:hypoxanthine-DNA glycosylase
LSDIESFPPIAGPRARVLILGSIPGIASLQAGQYYAHPRNQFWRILGELLGFDPVAAYADKTQALQDVGIALWDVVKACHRPGSLDANIDKQSIVANDFAGFLQSHPGIEQIFFNGATAEHTFQRLVRPNLQSGLKLQRLPSTSPANAGQSYQQKLESWRVVLSLLVT